MRGADEVVERSPWRAPARWSLVAVVTANVAGKICSIRYSKELLEIVILAPWGVYVDDTQSDLRKNVPSRLIRGQVNPVKDGGPLATRDLAWQDVSFPVLRACVFQGLR